jgi:hypothetical protein
MDGKLNVGESVWEAAYCYQNFGLLFPNIPQNQSNNKWENRRKIKLSPYEDEIFEEQATYMETVDETRNYEIKGALLPESKLKLGKYEGYIYVPANQLLPIEATVEVLYKNEDMTNRWNFILKSY